MGPPGQTRRSIDSWLPSRRCSGCGLLHLCLQEARGRAPTRGSARFHLSSKMWPPYRGLDHNDLIREIAGCADRQAFFAPEAAARQLEAGGMQEHAGHGTARKPLWIAAVSSVT
eukprot:TRINITY_DN100843_c0_g1_i1.p1 TRINITY_DN100843_c0_g1~~TRINITY_DN100843_c0_g1_i1.p1  ORF type:complete len:114 (-),score=8.05 TRINITY_DN100843_c0_g1_i1:26-367(-)